MTYNIYYRELIEYRPHNQHFRQTNSIAKTKQLNFYVGIYNFKCMLYIAVVGCSDR